LSVFEAEACFARICVLVFSKQVMDLGIKVLTGDNLSISLNDFKQSSNVCDDFFMVSRNDTSVGAAFIKIIDNLSNTFPDFILKAKRSHEA
jgi:hypothetical protein